MEGSYSRFTMPWARSRLPTARPVHPNPYIHTLRTLIRGKRNEYHGVMELGAWSLELKAKHLSVTTLSRNV